MTSSLGSSTDGEIAVETAQIQPFHTPGRRHVPRYAISVPVNVTVLRSGVPEGVPGRSVDVGEGGLCVVLAGDLYPGELVGVEFRLPHLSLSVLAKARVSYQHPMRCGMQFLGLSAEQRGTIRYWAERTGQRRTLAEVVEAEEAVRKEIEGPEIEGVHALRLAPSVLEEKEEDATLIGPLGPACALGRCAADRVASQRNGVVALGAKLAGVRRASPRSAGRAYGPRSRFRAR